MGSSRSCDLGVGSEVGILAAAGPFVPEFGMGTGEKCSHRLSTLEAPPLGSGGLETVRVSISMCQCDSKCVFQAAALGASVHLNPVGGEVGVGIARRSGGGCWDLLGSLSFLLREQLRFPAGDGWPGLRGGC